MLGIFQDQALQILEVLRGDLQLPSREGIMKTRKLINYALCAVWFLAYTCLSQGKEYASMDFDTIACPGEIILPKVGENTAMLIALKIYNDSSASIVINKHATPVPIIKNALGMVYQATVQSNVYIEPTKGDFTILKPKHATYILVEASIEREGDKYIMRGDLKDGGEWMITGVLGNSCEISLKYMPPEIPVPQSTVLPWNGKVVSKPTKVLFRSKP